MIQVQSLDKDTFQVTVEDTASSSHVVTLTDAYHQQLALGKTDKIELIQASFRFLLEREQNTSILSHFNLTTIGLYFPEYEKEIGKALKRGA